VSSACAAGRLAPDKTGTVHLDEGFDFLGFTIRRQRKRGMTAHYVYPTPSNKAIQKVTLILNLNRSLRGWANYFRYGVSKPIFSAGDQHAWRTTDALDTP
jgi:RNA-directed DNA polymerase